MGDVGIQQFPRRSIPPDIFCSFWFSDGTPGAPRPLLPIDSSIAAAGASGRRTSTARSSLLHPVWICVPVAAPEWAECRGSRPPLPPRRHTPRMRDADGGGAQGLPVDRVPAVREAVLLALGGVLYFDSCMLCSIVELVESPLVLTPPSSVEGVEIWLALRLECLVIH
ncbi:unnamed protein product [Urochloa humidicola]